jgi:AcrR family transcriptional regulator
VGCGTCRPGWRRPGTVYRHFPAKEALFQAVITARIEDLIEDAHSRAGADDPGGAFFGFLARIGEEAAAKRDLSEAIAIAGSLQDRLHAAVDVLLRRAQEAGAVRADIRTSDLIVLLKGLLATVRDASADTAEPDLRDRVLAVLTDGLRPPVRAAGTGTVQAR